MEWKENGMEREWNGKRMEWKENGMEREWNGYCEL